MATKRVPARRAPKGWGADTPKQFIPHYRRELVRTTIRRLDELPPLTTAQRDELLRAVMAIPLLLDAEAS